MHKILNNFHLTTSLIILKNAKSNRFGKIGRRQQNTRKHIYFGFVNKYIYSIYIGIVNK